MMVSRMQQYYKQAKTKVERQNQKISDLEKQLQEEKNKDSPHIEENQANKQQNEKNDCEKLDVLKKSNLKENVCSLHQLVGNLSGLTLDELHVSTFHVLYFVKDILTSSIYSIHYSSLHVNTVSMKFHTL